MTYLRPYSSSSNWLSPLAHDSFSFLDSFFDGAIYSASRHFDIDETDSQYTLTLELPGFKQSDLDISLNHGVLTVKANRGERTYESSVVVPRGVEVDKIDAKLEDGLLTLVLPKQELAKPRKIAIK